ncbi:phospholipid-transporting ATPase IM isoform X1-like [Oopsacas minuta]|uniref:Phospholipid-transporting ATPase n=1 Tax=Oopsacas minuta TaxID=111878 RepID=A0AAV7KGV6_9METZ|nr:phospholipid-transporting ATPase IM isoform X1-like [Oopsacas minuta]
MAELNTNETITADEPVVENEDERGEAEAEVPKRMNPLLWILGKRPMYHHRHIRANDSVYNRRWNYFENSISTSRYNIITFLPKNLFEQFQRVANIYFTLLLILQLIPQISSLTPITTILPLLFVLGTTLIKDGVDDLFRHISDYKINNRLVKVLQVTRETYGDGALGPATGTFVHKKWKHVIVGDIIKLNRDDFIPADLFIISSSEPNSLCYIETAELDGETNLKVKSALIETAEIEDNENLLSKFDGEFTTEPPNNVLSKFQGYFEWRKDGDQESKYYAFNDDNVLLRGCRVRNTRWVNGLVVFAGPDTKVHQNSGKRHYKRTRLDRATNYYVFAICIILLVTVSLVTIGNGVWEWLYGQYFDASGYLPYDQSVIDLAVVHTAFTSFLNFFSNLIILNTFIPISLYVSIEFIRLGQSYLISFDHKLYYKKLDTRARARTTTLSEELGNIEYVFSDKTGTLTENIMTMVKCSIAGKMYGFLESDFDEDYKTSGDDLGLELPPTPPRYKKVDFSWNEYHDPAKPFHDQTLVDVLHNKDQQVLDFFFALAICHTILPEADGDIDKLSYNAQSPDEEALVTAARNLGIVFAERSSNSISIKVYNSVTQEYEVEMLEVLAILDFDNVRKRMSVIVRLPNGGIRLYCKGADNVLFERTCDDSHELREKLTRQLKFFAKDGLRTLVIAYKDLTQKEFEEWNEAHTQANLSLENRDDKLSEVYELIEQNLVLLGATAIEDKLQDGVPETIASLAEANIKLWVLTGDKQETAINIGYSAHILNNDMKNIFIIEGTSFDEVEDELKTALADLHSAGKNKSNKFGFVISGASLKFALDRKLSKLFLEVASLCQAVICCRVTPLQKATIVTLVKNAKNVITLAIGDGANDVGMIQSAHIGVGISGREGQQAVLVSDFSFAQFRFLERLLLVHGRWSYLRMAKFLRYFFYKNFAFTWCHVWYGFFNGFSANAVFEPYYIALYNVLFTSIPVILMGITDQDVTDQYLLKYPRLYIAGQKGILFNKYSFFFALLKGAIVSLVIFFICFGSFYYNIYQGTGWETDTSFYFFLAITFPLTAIVNIQIGFDMEYWTILAFIVNIGSILVWFPYVLIVTSFPFYSVAPYWINGFPFVYSAELVLANTTFWLNACLAIAVCILPMMAFRFLYRDINPSLADDVQKEMTKDRSLKTPLIFIRDKIGRQRSPIEAIRYATGYAFSHDKGFGDLITTGRFKQSFYAKKQNSRKTPSPN